MNNKIIISKNNDNVRLDSFLGRYFSNMSKSLLYSFIRKRKIRINNKRIIDPSFRLKKGDTLIYYFVPKKKNNKKTQNETNLTIGNIGENIIYEDNSLLVVNKEYGVVMHSSRNSLNQQVENYLLLKGEIIKDQAFKVHHVHRLDKETKGLVIYAKTKKMQQILYTALKNRKLQKNYIAFITKINWKNKNSKKIVLDGYITYTKGMFASISSKETKNSKYAKIIVKKIKTINNAIDVLDIEAFTGRKHQIRILLSHFLKPIIFDKKYGKYKNNNLLLFCYKLKIPLSDKDTKKKWINIRLDKTKIIKQALKIISNDYKN